MSRKGNCWDNATAESFFNGWKIERVHGSHYTIRDQAKADLFEYIEMFYNRSRRHSALGGKSPSMAYQAWGEQLKQRHEPALTVSANQREAQTISVAEWLRGHP